MQTATRLREAGRGGTGMLRRRGWPGCRAAHRFARRRRDPGRAVLQLPGDPARRERRRDRAGDRGLHRRRPRRLRAVGTADRACRRPALRSRRVEHARDAARPSGRARGAAQVAPGDADRRTSPAIKSRFAAAGIDIHSFNYSFNESFTDAEIERGFEMAKALGAGVITASTTLSVAQRVVPFAEKHKHCSGDAQPLEHQRPQRVRHAGKLRRGAQVVDAGSR